MAYHCFDKRMGMGSQDTSLIVAAITNVAFYIGVMQKIPDLTEVAYDYLA